MIKHAKDILMYKVSKKTEIYNEEEINKIAQIAEKTSKNEIINIIYSLSKLEERMRGTSQKTIVFETEIIKLCIKEDIKDLEERINKLEEIVKNKFEVSNITLNNKPEISDKKEQKQIIDRCIENKEEKEKTIKNEQFIKEKDSNVNKNIISNWTNVLSNLKKQGKVMLYANLINTEAVEINDMTIGIIFKNGLNSFSKELLQKPENMNILTKEISIICGKPMQIKLEDADKLKQTSSKINTLSNLEKTSEKEEKDLLNTLEIPINFVEE